MRISKENIVAREKMALELFMSKPDMTASEAAKAISKRLPGGQMNHHRLYELRTKAQNALLKTGQIDKKPANKRGRRPGQTYKEVEFSANRDVTVPTITPRSLPRDLSIDEAVLIKLDSENQGRWLTSVLEQLSGRGLTNAKVVYVGAGHALVAGQGSH